MAVYIIYLVFLLSVIAFSPTRYFIYSWIALLSAIPGICYCLYKYPSKILIALLLLFALTVYAGWGNNLQLVDFGHHISNNELISSASIWLISFVVMKLTLHDKLLQKINFLKIYFFIFFLLGIFVMLEEFMRGHTMDEGANTVYYILPVLPCVMFFSPKIRYVAMITVFVLIILSIKRSAFIIVALSLLWLVFCLYKGIIKGNKTLITITAVSAALMFFLYFGNSSYVQAMAKRFSGISDDGGTGRDLIYAYAWELFLKADTIHQWLGFGPRYFWYDNTAISAAHNDFLEILISCGIVGVLIFLYLHIQLVKMLVFFVKRESDIAIPYFVCYITFLVWNLIACQFAYQSTTVCTCMFLAVVENYIYNEEHLIRCNKC